MKQATQLPNSPIKTIVNRILRPLLDTFNEVKSFYTYELSHQCSRCGFTAKNIKEVEQHIVYQNCSRGKIPLGGN